MDLVLVDPDDGSVTRLTRSRRFDEALADRDAAGTRIAFTRCDQRADLNRDIWVMDADGSDPTRLTTGNRADERPDWSPDGTMIAFNREGPSGRFGLWVMSASGSGATRLISGRFDFFPDWQPV